MYPRAEQREKCIEISHLLRLGREEREREGEREGGGGAREDGREEGIMFQAKKELR